MDIFGKKEIKALAAIKDVAADKITAEQVSAVNAEFVELGIKGVEVAIAGTLETVQANLASATESITAKDVTIAEHATSNSAKDVKIAELEASIVTLGGKKAEEPTGKGKEEDKIESESDDFDFDKSASAKAMDAFFKH